MMNKNRIIYHIPAILFGISVLIYGGIDDSPGAQLLGVLAVIIGIVGIIESRRKISDNDFYNMIKKIILVLVVIAMLVIASGFFSLFYTVRKTCNSAKEKHQGKCQTALVSVLEDKNASPKEKNDAIWALGQMADSESLSPLEKIYIGKVPEGREPLNEVISQYEIEKAIRWVKNGNITSWMYGCLKK